jgi:hypothetical protein
VVLQTIPPCLLLPDGTLQDLTPEQAVLLQRPDFLARLDQLADAAEDLGNALDDDPTNPALIAELESVTGTIRALLRENLSGPLLRIFGIPENDDEQGAGT